ncbi:hypothetical protein OUZ56_002665 [Daphnia magna]|uniref:4Fe-4S ferredoxin-type domain-containing protein n=1 Tax=Daphnia magna TaxID=35525 RepID=A0ABR0A6W7_9CRUS|nr:hypothetical protein OUZ56_002665 [Daphnia magna]
MAATRIGTCKWMHVRLDVALHLGCPVCNVVCPSTICYVHPWNEWGLLFSIHNRNGFEEDIDGVLEKVVRVAEEEEIAVNPVLKEAKHSDDMGAQPVETKTLCLRYNQSDKKIGTNSYISEWGLTPCRAEENDIKELEQICWQQNKPREAQEELNLKQKCSKGTR